MSDTRNSQIYPASIFHAFSWHNADVPPSHQKAFTEYAHDVSNGIATLLLLIEFSDGEAQDDRPFLSKADKATLMRLAIASSRMLATAAEKQIDSENEAYSQH